MAKPSKNQLNITQLPTEPGKPPRWALDGYADGKRVRIQSGDLDWLNAEKKAREDAAKAQAAAKKQAGVERPTRQSVQQLTQSDAAWDRLALLGDKAPTLLTCVEEWIKRHGGMEPITCVKSLELWKKAQEAEGLSDVTVRDNQNRVKQFLAHAKPVMVADVTAAMIKEWAYECESIVSRVARASRVRAWLNYCKKELKAINASPIEFDFKGLKERAAKAADQPHVLTPDEARRLLEEARQYEDGMLVPYVILATWCFVRHAEVVATAKEQARQDGDEFMMLIYGIKKGSPPSRLVTVPANVQPLLAASLAKLEAKQTVPWTQAHWNNLRENAGLITRGEYSGAYGTSRAILNSKWEENTLRHTGITYHHRVHKNIALTTDEAGNSPSVAFKHYVSTVGHNMTLADAKRFYAPFPTKPVLQKKAEVIQMSA